MLMFMKSSYNEMRKAVLEKIRPKEEEIQQIREAAAETIEKIKKKGYRAVLVGSAGRSTCIAGDKDLDIFTFFPKSMGREELEKRALKLGKEVLGKNAKTHFAEHPYVKGYICGFEVEVVPCYEMKIGERPRSAVDRSPLHQKYVMKHLKESKKDDVLLLKQLLKGIGAYGAEHKVKGFSGYLCELLTIKYGSFEKVLAAAQKFTCPFIFIDPVDKNRNAAAAVSEEKLALFKKRATEFLKTPALGFFFPKETPVLRGFNEKRTIMISFPVPRVVEEILWSQLERLKELLFRQLKISGFNVAKALHWSDERKTCLLAFEFKEKNIREKYLHGGPMVGDEQNVAAFKAKNKANVCFEKEGRLWCWRRRERTDAKKMLVHLLKTIDVPSHFRIVIKKAKTQ